MNYVKLAPNATRYHRAPKGEMTYCGRRVPQHTFNLKPTGQPLYPVSKTQFEKKSCPSCTPARRRAS